MRVCQQNKKRVAEHGVNKKIKNKNTQQDQREHQDQQGQKTPEQQTNIKRLPEAMSVAVERTATLSVAMGSAHDTATVVAPAAVGTLKDAGHCTPEGSEMSLFHHCL
jgi:3-polyprenyl-4-hydroxybenzoate decarboxylase